MTTIDIRKKYSDFCQKHNVSFENIETVNSYDDTTLFCPAGMQKYKSQFKDLSFKGTVANVQSCIRLNDYDLCKNDINKMNLNYPIVILDKRTDKKTFQKLKKMNKTIGIYTINSYNDNLKDDLRFYSEVDYFIFDKLIK